MLSGSYDTHHRLRDFRRPDLRRVVDGIRVRLPPDAGGRASCLPDLGLSDRAHPLSARRRLDSHQHVDDDAGKSGGGAGLDGAGPAVLLVLDAGHWAAGDADVLGPRGRERPRLTGLSRPRNTRTHADRQGLSGPRRTRTHADRQGLSGPRRTRTHADRQGLSGPRNTRTHADSKVYQGRGGRGLTRTGKAYQGRGGRGLTRTGKAYQGRGGRGLTRTDKAYQGRGGRGLTRTDKAYQGRGGRGLTRTHRVHRGRGSRRGRKGMVVERRTFMSSMFGTTLLAAAGVSAGGAGQNRGSESTTPSLYTWRQYILRTGTQPRRLAEFLQTAAIPALNRLGRRPIGVFEVMTGLPTPTVFVMTPHDSLESLLSLEGQLDKDQEFVHAAASYTDAPASDPVYVRQEVALLTAFPKMPRIEVPGATASQGPRLFELRTYESPSEHAHRAKVRMFEEMGEIDIFRKCGLTPVFFSRTLAGPRMPSLVYMLVHDNLGTRDKSWSAFRDNPGLAQALRDAGLHGSRDRLEHHDRAPAAGGVFADLTAAAENHALNSGHGRHGRTRTHALNSGHGRRGRTRRHTQFRPRTTRTYADTHSIQATDDADVRGDTPIRPRTTRTYAGTHQSGHGRRGRTRTHPQFRPRTTRTYADTHSSGAPDHTDAGGHVRAPGLPAQTVDSEVDSCACWSRRSVRTPILVRNSGVARLPGRTRAGS